MFDNCPLVPLGELQAMAAAASRRSVDTLGDLPVPACQQIWRKPLADGSVAVAVVNFDAFAVNVTCDSTCFAKLGFATVRTGGVRFALPRLWCAHCARVCEQFVRLLRHTPVAVRPRSW